MNTIFRLIVLSLTSIFLFSTCKREPEIRTYAAKLQVKGSALNQIYFRSAQKNFDVSNVPGKEWLSDNSFKGNDTLILYGKQTLDPLNFVVVSIKVDYSASQSITYSDSGDTEAMVKVLLPK